jgi:hypothetical protein
VAVSTLAVSCVDTRLRSLRTLVNTGVLGPGEERRPAGEAYRLVDYPSAAMLVRTRRPYFSIPEAPADDASAELERALQKTSQAAAPLVIADRVWGELWMSSVAGDLPVAPNELPFVEWTARRYAARMAALIEPAGVLPALPRSARMYDVRVAGRIGGWFMSALAPAAVRIRSRC